MIMSENIKYKVCNTCETKKELTAEYWHRNKSKKDGYRSTCKVCRGCKPKRKIKEGYKYCNKCEEEKELTAEYWHRNKDSKDGYGGQCRDCMNQYNKQYRAENKERIARYQEQYYEENKERIVRCRKQYYQTEQGRKNHARAKQNRRARINSLPDTLTTEQYNENLDHFDYKCAYCECELTPDNHHIEHVYPISKGKYGTTKENCIPSCESCNSSKGPKTISEWYVWTEDYSFERLLKIHEITSGGKEWIIN